MTAGDATPRSPSEELYERALRVLPGGVSRNTVLHRPHPFYAAKGEGCWVTDLEGVRRLDFANNMCSLIHGHAHPAIVAAVIDQLERGSAFTFATEAEVDYAEYMCGRSASFEKIRFVNSGTEAVMSCLKAARAFTGREKIAKVEGAYHGMYDYAEVSQTSNPSNWGDPDRPPSNPVTRGTPRGVLDDVVIIPFNRPEAAVKILEEHAGELACVLIDPMPHRVGFMPATADYIDALRRFTAEDGSLLVFDEVITFRSEFDGAQAWYQGNGLLENDVSPRECDGLARDKDAKSANSSAIGACRRGPGATEDEVSRRPVRSRGRDFVFRQPLRPDLTALGKMIGGGLPVGGIAGRADVMEVLNPLAQTVLFPHSGTFSANPLVMAAGYAAMRLFDREAVPGLNALGDYARFGIRRAIADSGFPASVTGAGSLLRIHMTREEPTTYREAYVDPERARLTKALLDYAFDHGIMLINTCSAALSTALTEREIDTLCEVLLGGFRALQ